MLFTYIEINRRLCRMISQKKWESQPAQRMSFMGKVQFSKASDLLQQQVLLETIDEANKRLKNPNPPLSYAF